MKIITNLDKIPLREVDIVKIKTAPKNGIINQGIGILSKIATYNYFEDILKGANYFEDIEGKSENN